MHMPKPFWQPLNDMHWLKPVPHDPDLEQHVPNLDPAHVKPLAPPQLPSVDAFLAVTAAAEVAAGLADVAAEVAAGLADVAAEVAAGLADVAAA
jgi:hypothetical protein